MTEYPILKLKSLGLFAFLFFGNVLTLIVLILSFSTHQTTIEKTEQIAILIFAVIVMPWLVWTTAYIIDLYDDRIVKSGLFGLGPTETYHMEDLKECDIDFDHYEKLRVIVLKFPNGTVRLHMFQQRFTDAIFFLRAHYEKIMALAEEDGKWVKEHESTNEGT